jgi:hypothetical protein
MTSPRPRYNHKYIHDGLNGKAEMTLLNSAGGAPIVAGPAAGQTARKARKNEASRENSNA